MQPIYVTYNNKLCVKKSYLKRFLGLTDDILSKFDEVKKRNYSSSALLEFKKLPYSLRILIIEIFGTEECPNHRPERNYCYHLISKIYMIEIRRLKKRI